MKSYSIHKEGHRILGVLAVLLLILNFTLYFFLSDMMQLRLLTAVASGLLFLFVLAFFRIPRKRFMVDNGELIVAPADGRIVVIEEVEEPEYFKDKRIQVSIFMSPTNVHVNRVPIPGTVQYTKYHPGHYLVAWHPKSSTKNERYTTVIKHDESEFEVMVRQIAGKVARKISNYVDEGQQVLQGHEFGFIKFGSRVDIFLPIGTEINVNLRDKVQGGKTVIAKLVD